MSRRIFHLARAFYKMPTRRPKEYPKTVAVNVLFGKYGPKREVLVPLSDAPIVIVAPIYRTDNKKDAEGRIWSLGQLEVTQIDRERFHGRVDAILRRYKAHSVTMESLPFKVNGDFERTIWKTAYGFFWLTDRDSLEASAAKAFIFGTTELYQVRGNEIYYQDMFSRKRQKLLGHRAAAAVYTMEEENHSHLYCEMNFFEKLGLPLYYCRILNASGQPFERVNFID
ncbi:hypothetical protein [Gemmobacter megaterium]|uniref:hypothetical protein n=1 Tax=Gemmobacter megaterium TaxID=1086013 RepID=UPI001181ACF6|nr:hypothetical protein [Gemmobacter megaterium]